MRPIGGIKGGAAAGLAALIAICCYLNTLGNGFVFDDLDAVARNPLVTEDVPLSEIVSSHYWRHVTAEGNLYRPLVIWSYALNHRLGGAGPWGFHLVNLLLHALASALVVLLGARLGLPAGAAAAAGSLFAAHPIHTEAVAGVVGRAELLAALGVMGGWLAHLSRSRAGPAAAGALYLAGLLSKENAVVLPALMLAGDVGRLRSGRAGWARLAPAYAACGLAFLLWMIARSRAVTAVTAGSIADSLFTGVPALYRVLTALEVLGRYLGLLVLPVTLSADYSFQQIPLVTSWAHPASLVSALLHLALAAAAAVSLRSDRVEGLCAAAYLVALSPVSNLLVPIGTIMAERLLYLPSVFFCLGVSGLTAAVLAGRRAAAPPASPRPRPVTTRAAAAATVLLVLLYAGRTRARNAEWRDQLTLFSATVATSPRSAKAHYNLGVALEDAGRPEEALREYLAAVAILPEEARAHHNAGLLLARAGRLEEAAAHLQAAARHDPAIKGLFSNLGALYSEMGRPREAEEALRLAVEREPEGHDALYNLGTLLLSQRRAREALDPLQRARLIDPGDADGRYQLGLALLEAGRPRDAVAELREALALEASLQGAWIPIARAHRLLGEMDEARQAAARARAAGLTLPRDLEEPPGRR